MAANIRDAQDPPKPTGEALIPAWLPWAAAVLVVGMFLILALAQLSNTETVLLGIVQTIFSLFAGWGLTHAYAKDSERKAVREIEEIHQRNLRTYALKAAEKVENLSRELNRLVIYLDQELEEDCYETPIEELSAKEERIQSAIHILNTLKSVNDTSLSDWRGVIGNEIDEILHKAEKREEVLEKIVDRVERLESASVDKGSDESGRLLREMDKLRRDLKYAVGDVTGNLWSARKQPQSARQTFQSTCPSCGAPVSARLKMKERAAKGVVCASCGARLVAEVTDGRVRFRPRVNVSVEFACPSCETPMTTELDELIGASAISRCLNCELDVRATRSKEKVLATLVKQNNALSEEVIEYVRRELPDQPWPKGIHEVVANELGISQQVVKKAINQLILKGIFKDQFRGVLCTPEEKLVMMRSIGTEI